MKKKYVVAAPDNNYNPLFYKEGIGFTEGLPSNPVSMEKAIRICKNSPLSIWIIEFRYPEIGNIVASRPFEFKDFIDNCKTSNLEVIETRPSIYASSETEPAIPEKEVEFGYVIKYNAIYFLCEIKTYNDGLYTVNNISKSAIIFRKKKEAEFQAKVLKLKCNENFSVEKVNLNTFFKQ